MVGKLAIFNMALGFIGTRTLASEKESTPEAIQCRLFWDRARRSALRDFPYSFAQKRFCLEPVEMPETHGADFSHAYTVPAEALKVVKIGDYAPFVIERGLQGAAIYCDEADAVAICTVDVPEPAMWDELFIMAMAYRLAMLIAVPLLKNNPQKIQELASLYQQALPQAQAIDASERRKAKMQSESWIEARWNWA